VEKREGVRRTASRLLDRSRRQGSGKRVSAEEFGRGVTELAREAHLDALVLVIGRDGLQSVLSTEARQLRELLEYVKRLLDEYGKRLPDVEAQQSEERAEDDE
jgi:hypothetical protein